MNGPTGEQTDPVARVLLIDDDEASVLAMRQALEAAGYATISARDGATALPMLERYRPAVVVLDCALPDMSIEEFLGNVREAGEPAEIIVATDHGSEAIAAAMLQRSVRAYLIKDGSFRERLVASVTLRVAERRLRRQVEQERARLASILRVAPIGIGLVVDRVFEEVNDTFCAMVGYHREELIGHDSSMIYPSIEEYRRVGREKYDQIARTGSGTVETQFRRKDGRILDVRLASTVLDRSDPGRGVTFTAHDITLEKRSQRILKEAADRWRRTFDAVPDMICVLDRDQRIITANRAMAERVGMSAEDIIGRQCYDIVHRMHQSPDSCPFLLLDTKTTVSAEIPEASLGRTYDVTVTPICDSEGVLAGAVHVMRDITERVRAQQESEHVRDFLDCVINAVADPIFVKDAEHRWVLVNDAECELTGLSREQMLGKTDRDYFPAEQADVFWARDAEVLRTGQSQTSVEELTDAAGRVRTIMTSKSLHVGRDGEKYVVGVSKDITELMSAQHELQRSRSRLESLYRLAIGTFANDQELMDYAVNEAVQMTFSTVGFAAFVQGSEVDQRSFAWSRRIGEQCTAAVRAMYPFDQAGVWADSARSMQPVICNDMTSFAGKTGFPDGHVDLQRFLSVPITDEGAVVMIVVVGNKATDYDETDARDLQLFMTEVWHLLQRHKAEFDLRRANEELDERVRMRTAELQAAIEELDAFAYSVSHDLTRPLRYLSGHAGALEMDFGASLPSGARDFLTKIRKGARDMEDMINALLAMSRASRGELVREAVNLSELATDVVEELRATDPDRNVTVRIQPNVTAHCDRRLARVILENLLGNAWKFTGQQPTAVIEFGASEGERRRRVYYVRDDGAGFDMTYAQRLFGAFQRFHTEREFPGHGIGLATVRRAVRRHGGDIWAESAVGQGATFRFTLEP